MNLIADIYWLSVAVSAVSFLFSSYTVAKKSGAKVIFISYCIAFLPYTIVFFIPVLNIFLAVYTVVKMDSLIRIQRKKRECDKNAAKRQ